MSQHRLFPTTLGCLVLCLGGCGTSADKPSEPTFQDEIARAQRESKPEVRAERLIRIGYRQGKARDTLAAEETLRLAAKECEAIGDPTTKSGAWSLLAQAQAALGNRIAAGRAVEASLAAAANIPSVEVRAVMLARALQVPDASLDRERAVASLRQAESLTPKMADVRDKVLALGEIAHGYHALNNAAESERTIQAAVQQAKTAEDARKRSLALAEAAVLQTELHEAAAVKTFDDALQAAEKIESVLSRTYALGDIAEKLSQAGYHRRAHQVLQQAERLTGKIPGSDIQTQALQQIRAIMRTLPKESSAAP